MSSANKRVRGEAFTGKGYGTLRFHLLANARHHIEKSITQGFYCEAIAIIESVITDRLESRLSYLKGTNIGFAILGPAIQQLQGCEIDTEIKDILLDLDTWRKKRNAALHELVKVEADQPMLDWEERLATLSSSANEGYELLKKLYHRVADLNPLHSTRAFPHPS